MLPCSMHEHISYKKLTGRCNQNVTKKSSEKKKIKFIYGSRPNFASNTKQILASYLASTPCEIIKKNPLVFSWFQGE